MAKATSAISPFSFRRVDLTDNNYLYIVDIKVIQPTLRRFIDRKICELAFGEHSGDLDRVKRRLRQFLNTKRGTVLEIGAIAEFFVHLFLIYRRLTPRFIVANLEEGSLKKGFDGLYSHLNEEWLCESKSGSLSSENVTHARKVKEAYKDLQKKLAGEDTNNPWMNALRHAKNVNSEPTLLKKIQKLSERYEDGDNLTIEESFIIPCATVYLDGEPGVDDRLIERQVKSTVESFSYKGIRIVCITKESVAAFWAYLNS
jgi:hypothetical protein